MITASTNDEDFNSSLYCEKLPINLIIIIQ